jgi:hypothetical protein
VFSFSADMTKGTGRWNYKSVAEDEVFLLPRVRRTGRLEMVMQYTNSTAKEMTSRVKIPPEKRGLPDYTTKTKKYCTDQEKEWQFN